MTGFDTTSAGDIERRLAAMTAEEIDAGSIEELDAGRLPLRAQQRLATIRADAAFTSALSVDAHHAVRSVGFRPVGQVMGAAVVHPGTYALGSCGYYVGGFSYGLGQAPVAIATGLEGALASARASAMSRLLQECAGLGGDGVVDVRLTMRPFVGGALEALAIGTAIKAVGDVRPASPFTSDLSGQDFAKLLLAGWLPVGLVMGTAVLLRHDDYTVTWQTGSWNNTEVTGITELVINVRERARDALRRDAARYAAEHVVLRDLDMRLHRRQCGSGREAEDHVAESLAIGTALVALRHGRARDVPKPLPILKLS